MSLLTPALRLSLLFTNVWDTYKTLKPPSFSRSGSGRVSVKAMSKRKRDMKGCVAIWMVWCCLAIYERAFENFVRIFVPFYEEFKVLFLLFLMFTKAKGSEPIYLHLIRPFLKPYTPTIDLTLDLLRMAGDILFYLTLVPIRAAHDWWLDFKPTSLLPRLSELAAIFHAGDDSAPPPYQEYPSETLARPVTPPRRRAVAQVARTTSSNPSNIVHAMRAQSPYQIWYPPASVMEEEESSQQNEALTAPPADSTSPPRTVEEWRLYPPFPSAYPPTPLPVTATFPSIPRGIVGFPPISETPDDASSDVWHTRHSASPEETPRRTRTNSRSDSTLAASTIATVGRVESDTEVAEDDFDVTLRTIPRLSIDTIKLPSAGQDGKDGKVSAASSVQAETILSTMGGDSLGSRSRSVSSSSVSSVSTTSTSASSQKAASIADSSMATLGQKRPRVPSTASGPTKTHERVWSGGTIIGIRPINSQDGAAGSSQTDEESSSSEVPDDRSVPGIKRRRVGSTASSSSKSKQMSLRSVGSNTSLPSKGLPRATASRRVASASSASSSIPTNLNPRATAASTRSSARLADKKGQAEEEVLNTIANGRGAMRPSRSTTSTRTKTTSSTVTVRGGSSVRGPQPPSTVSNDHV